MSSDCQLANQEQLIAPAVRCTTHSSRPPKRGQIDPCVSRLQSKVLKREEMIKQVVYGAGSKKEN